MLSKLRGFRRTAMVSAAWVAALAVLWVPTAASGEEEPVEPGLGNAYAQGYKIDPRSGRLSFGITYGEVIAGHQNSLAQAQSRAVNLGVIGTTLGGEGCDGGEPTYPREDQPQAMIVRSDEEGASEGRSDNDFGVQRYVEAGEGPYARSVATTSGGGEPGAFEMGGTRSETLSGVVDGVRQAIARTDVSYIDIGGGAVVLRGLRWEAIHSTAPTESLAGSFHIDGIEVGGQSLPIPEDNPFAGIEAINEAIGQLGFEIHPPAVRQAEGIVFVDPLKISVVPNDNRDGITGPILSGAQPARESLFDALIEADCSNASYITVGDVVLGSITGAGSLNLEVGGVTATTSDLEVFDGFGPIGGFTPPTVPSATPTTAPPATTPARPASPTRSVGTPTAGTPSPTTTAAPAAAPVASPVATPTPQPTETQVALPEIEPVVGERGGPLLLVGAGGLATILALAEGDRRKLRSAARSLPMEA